MSKDAADQFMDFALHRRLVRSLVPCPFCADQHPGAAGASARCLILVDEDDRFTVQTRYLVACGNCGTRGPWAIDIATAAAKWNRRPAIEGPK